MSGKPVVGSVSSRVMNMKFMRFASNRENSENSQSSISSNSGTLRGSSSGNDSNVENVKSFHDNSEWSLTDNRQDKEDTANNNGVKTIKLNIRRKNMLKVRSGNQSIVGVTMLQRGNLSVKGKTSFGGEAIASVKNDDINIKKRKFDSDATLENENKEDEGEKGTNEDDGYDLDKIFKDTMKKSKKPKKDKKNKKHRKNWIIKIIYDNKIKGTIRSV